MDTHKLLRQRRVNGAFTLGTLGCLAATLVLLGWLFAGAMGLLWILILGGLMLSVRQTAGSALLRRHLGAEPLPAWMAPDLHRVVRELARSAGLRHVPRLRYIPTATVQALAAGADEDAAIGLSDGLLRVLSPREIAAVVAHEIWHLRQRDLGLMRLAAAAVHLTQSLCLAVLVLSISNVEPIAAGEIAITWPALLLLAVAPTASTLLWLALSRTREFDADAGAAALTGDPDALASALRRLDRAAGRRWEMPFPGIGGAFWSRWLSTHPSADDRVARLLELAPPKPRRALFIPVCLFTVPAAGAARAARFLRLGTRPETLEECSWRFR